MNDNQKTLVHACANAINNSEKLTKEQRHLISSTLMIATIMGADRKYYDKAVNMIIVLDETGLKTYDPKVQVVLGQFLEITEDIDMGG